MSQSKRSRSWIIVALVLALILLLLTLARCGFQEPVSTPPTHSHSSAGSEGQASAPVSDSGIGEEVLGPASITARGEVNAGQRFAVSWTGPGNPKDYITIVRSDAPDTAYGNYELVHMGSPLELLAPIETGEWELRYVADQSRTVLARRSLMVAENVVTLQAPSEVVAGAVVAVSWTGPDNEGDYLTFVPRSTPDGQYGNYKHTRDGSPVGIAAPITPGEIELRYMTGQGAKVLGRFTLRVVAAEVSLTAPVSVRAGEKVTVTWTGPGNAGDYLTLVPASLPDGQYASYANASGGQTLTLVAPVTAGPAEIRYMSGQGAKVLKRRPILVVP